MPHPGTTISGPDHHHLGSRPPPPVPLPARCPLACDLSMGTSLDPAGAADPLALTPLRAHYLKKELLRRAVATELAALSRPDALSLLGPPFRPVSASSSAAVPPAVSTDLPILRFIFHQFVLTFPLLRGAPPSMYADKLQVFAEQLLASNLSSSDDRAQETKRRRLSLRLQRYFVLLLSSALTTHPPEQVVRLSEDDTKRLAALESHATTNARGKVAENHFDVNIIAVRLVTQRGIVSRRHHELFLIRSRRGTSPVNVEQVLVARRYGDFCHLANTLRTQFPELDVPSPPAKDRSHVSYLDDDGSDPVLPGSIPGAAPRATVEPGEQEIVKLSREKNRLTLRAYLKSLLVIPELADSVTMRAFLTSEPTNLTPDEVRDAAVREALDVARQSEAARFAAEATARVQALQTHLAAFKADLVQPDGLARVFATVKRVPHISQLPPSYRAVVAWARISAASTLFHLFRKGDRSSELLTQLKHIHSMMPYRILRGILRISNPVAMIRAGLDLFLAQPFGQKSLIQRMFLSGIGEEVKELQQVQQLIENKIADPDLAARVHTYVNLSSDKQDRVREQGHQPGYDLMTAILLSPSCGSSLNREQMQRCAQAAASYARYTRTRELLEAQGRSDQDTGPPDEAAWLFEDLHVLLRTAMRVRDKEQMLTLLSEGVTANLLKDMVTIFYAPLAQVYKAANIADSLGDLQAFITDLIATVEGLGQPQSSIASLASAATTTTSSSPTPSSTGTNSLPGGLGAQHTVQVFIDLVGRHEQAFYSFVHNVHSRGSGLFDGLMDWLQRIINLIRGAGPEEESTSPTSNVGQHGSDHLTPPDTTGAAEHAQSPLTQKGGLGLIDLEVLLPAGPGQRAALLAEADQLVAHAYQSKLVREMKVRRKLIRQRAANAAENFLASQGRQNAEGQTDAPLDEWDTADDAAFSSEVMKHLGFGGTVRDEVVDATLDAAADSDEMESTSDGQSEYSDYDGSRRHAAEEEKKQHLETRLTDMRLSGGVITDAWGNEGVPAPLPTKPRPNKHGEPPAPKLELIPELVPMFLELVRGISLSLPPSLPLFLSSSLPPSLLPNSSMGIFPCETTPYATGRRSGAPPLLPMCHINIQLFLPILLRSFARCSAGRPSSAFQPKLRHHPPPAVPLPDQPPSLLGHLPGGALRSSGSVGRLGLVSTRAWPGQQGIHSNSRRTRPRLPLPQAPAPAPG